MALTRVQATGKAHGTGGVSFASPPTVGNAIVVLITSYGTLPSTVTDNHGNTYSLAIQTALSNEKASIFYCASITATGTPFTVDAHAGSFSAYSAVEISGAGGLQLEATSSGTGVSTAVGSGATAALTVAEVLLAGVCTVGSNQASITVEALTPAWVEEHEELNYSTWTAGEGDTRLLSSGATGLTPAANWTLAATTDWAAVIAAFKVTPPSAAATARTTQVVAETLILPTLSARTTQVVAETLILPTLSARTTQVVAETLVFATPDARITQVAVETLIRPQYGHLSQVVVETLTLTSSAPVVPPVPSGTLARYLSFATPAAPGLQTITGVGFAGIALILWGTRQAKRRADDQSILSVGMTDGGDQVCRSIIHPDNETATTSAQAEWIDRLVYETTATSGATPSAVNHAEFVAFTADGFTLNWIAVDGGRDIRHVIVFGGSESVQANYVPVKIDEDIGVPISVTGVGFTPDCFIVIGGAVDEFSVGSTGYAVGAPFGSICGFGFSDGAGTDICGWTLGRGTGGAADSYRGQHTDRVSSIRVANLSGAGDLCSSKITAILPDGFVMQRTAGDHEPIQHVLALRGVRFTIGSFTTPATPSTTTLPLDFAPHLVLLQTHGLAAAEGDGLGLAFGFRDRIQSGGIWIGGVDESSPSVYARANYHARVLQLRTPLADGPTSPIVLEATIADMDAVPVEIDWSVVPTPPVLVNYLALAPAEWAVPAFENASITTGLTYMRLRTRSGVDYYWSDRPLPDPDGYEGGWKDPRVVEWGKLRRALSGFDGQYETADVVVTLDDTDRLLRELDKQGELVNATVIVKMLSDDQRRLLVPWSIVFRGTVRDGKPKGTLLYELTIKDPFAERFALEANPVPERVVMVEDFPNCAVETVASSAVGYEAGATAAGADTVTLTAGTGTFANDDRFTFAGHATVYAVTETTFHDPETSVKFSPSLTDAVSAGELLTVAATHKIEPAVGRRVPFWYGHITDQTFDDTGYDTGDGQAPLIYVGDRVMSDGHTYGEFLWAGHACYCPEGAPIPALYFWNENLNDLHNDYVITPDIGTLDDEADSGGRIALPGWNNWTSLGFTAPYVDYNGRRYTVVFLRGIFRDWALDIHDPPPFLGGVPFCADAYGCEDVGNGSGQLITDACAQYLHILQNWAPPRGHAYQSGAWADTLTFVDDPTVKMIDDDSFSDAQAQSVVYTTPLGESQGFRGDFGVGITVGGKDEPIAVRDLIARLNVSFGLQAGFSRTGQFFVTMPIRDPALLVFAQALTWERDVFAGTFAIDALTRDLYTTLAYRHTVDFLDRTPGGWRSIITGELETSDAAGIALYGADTTFSTVNLYALRGKNRATDPDEYTRGTITASCVLALALARSSRVQHIPKLQTGPAGVLYELGEVFALTHYEGLSVTGWTDRPVRIERIEVDPASYTATLETYDLDPILVEPGTLANATAPRAGWTKTLNAPPAGTPSVPPDPSPRAGPPMGRPA